VSFVYFRKIKILVLFNKGVMNAMNGLKDKHHILPQSRIPELTKEEKNVILVDVNLHRLYHLLFANMTPSEVMAFLNATFWGNSFEIFMIPNGNIKKMLLGLNGNKPPMPRKGIELNQTFFAAYQVVCAQKSAANAGNSNQ
jgi:hypothetical protein